MELQPGILSPSKNNNFKSSDNKNMQEKYLHLFIKNCVLCEMALKYHMKLADLNIISQSNSIRVVFGRNATKDISNNNYTKFHLPTKEPNYLRQS